VRGAQFHPRSPPLRHLATFVSNAISGLEQELGGALFQRKHAMALTALGSAVRPYLDQIARNADHVREVARILTRRPVANRSARQAVDSWSTRRIDAADAWQQFA
jgi:DNA-binding transcriptional LysR family regulator